MAIGFRQSSFGDPAGAGTVTISKPTGTASTDILIVVFNTAGSVGAARPAATGWTQVGTTVTTSQYNLQVFWALGSVASLGFTTSGTHDTGWVCLAFTGVDNATPIDATGASANNTAAGTLSAPAVTVATSGAWEVIGATAWTSGLASATSFSAVNNGATPNEPTACLYNLTPLGTGSTGTVTVTESGTTTGQVLAVQPFALRPAVVALTPMPAAVFPDRIYAPLDVIAY